MMIQLSLLVEEWPPIVCVNRFLFWGIKQAI